MNLRTLSFLLSTCLTAASCAPGGSPGDLDSGDHNDEADLIYTPTVVIEDGQMMLSVPVGPSVDVTTISPDATFLGEVSAAYGMSSKVSIRSFQMDFEGSVDPSGAETGGGPNAYMTRGPIDLNEFLGEAGWQQLRVKIWGPIGDAGRISRTYVWDVKAGDDLPYETEGQLASPVTLVLERNAVPRCCASSFMDLTALVVGELDGPLTAEVEVEDRVVTATLEYGEAGHYVATDIDLGEVGYAPVVVEIAGMIAGEPYVGAFASDESRHEGILTEVSAASAP